MALGHSQATLIGNLTRELDVRPTQSGKKIANFTLAVNKTKDKVDYFDCIAWEQKAEVLEKFTKKGDRLFVTGYPSQNSWEDKDGNKRSKVEFVVNDFLLLTQKSDDTPAAKPRDTVPEDIDDKPISLADIPF